MILDDKATYELTKVGTKNSNSRYVLEGQKVRGDATKYGDRLVVGTIITSPIVTATLQDTGGYIVETVNSIYTLEKVN